MEVPSSRRRVLVVEGETPSAPSPITQALALEAEILVTRHAWGPTRTHRSEGASFDLVVVVTESRGQTDIERLCQILRTSRPTVPILAIVPTADAVSLDLVSRVADDFVLSPFHIEELRHRLDRVLAEPHHAREVARRHLLEDIGLAQLIGNDPLFVDAVQKLPRFAKADATVLISGETGTGKELCARAIHHLSRRRSMPFIAVDSGALPEALVENELFGHSRGAFTDAHRDHQGLIALAQGGTLFLDEIDALPLAAQAKILRFLQERTFRPLGSDRFERADVRLVAATNRDLETCVQGGHFRRDLYFRLNVLRLHLPPLRERRSDIELLACSALKDRAAALNSHVQSFSPPALSVLTQHDWPGNVRELNNVVERAVVACDDRQIRPEHLDLRQDMEEPSMSGGPFRVQRAAAIAAFERRYVEELLRKHRGNVTHAAREANQDRRAFGRFIKKYGINRRTLTA